MEFFQETSIIQSKRWSNKTNVIKFKIKVRKTIWQFIKKLKIELPYDNSTSSHTFKREENKQTYIHTKICTQMFIAALFK